MKWQCVNKSVYQAIKPVVCIDDQDINFLKTEINNSIDKRIRICAHQTHDAYLHEMFILIDKSSYIRPHKHLEKSESFHVIEGLIDVVIFDDAGEILQIIPMGDFSSGKCFFYRLSSPLFHTLIVHSPYVVIHETTQGPFSKEHTIYPDWAPSAEMLNNITAYTNNLYQRITAFQKV